MSRKKRLGWPEVLKVLQGTETKNMITNHVRTLGFEPASWGSPLSLQALTNSITKAEDYLELQTDSKLRLSERKKLQTIRRQLEEEYF